MLQNKSGENQFILFVKNNIYLIIAFFICTFLVFYNLGKIEFWGEDEAQTLLYASRFIIGLKNQSLANATAFYSNSTFSFVILVQIPFILIFGVTELASRMPSAIITILTLFVIYKIGKLFLNKRSVNFLVLAYAVSGAVGLFKSSIGVGFYIFFILLGFFYLEKFLYASKKQSRGRFKDLQLGLIFIVMSLVSVPDAYFFIPFFFILILLNIKKIGIKKLLLSLIAPIVIFASFIYFEFILPRQLTGFNNATYDHFIGRKGGLELSFNIKEFFFGYINNFSIYFVILFMLALITLIVLMIYKKIKIPGIIIRIVLLFSLHFIIWMFFTKSENGHLANSYPVALLILAFVYGSISSVQEDNGIQQYEIKKNVLVKRILLNLVIIGFLCLNFYHTFVLFNNLSLNKDGYPGFYTPGKIPAGYVYGHKVGIKSVAYLLRKDNYFTGGLVSHHGSAFNFIYMGGEIIIYHSSDAIDQMIAGEDISNKYHIRYIGISPDFGNKDFLDYIDLKGFKKIVVKYKNKEIYYVYDILTKNNDIIIIERDEFDREYDREYSNIDDALPYFNGF